jgi:hypothetical protein
VLSGAVASLLALVGVLLTQLLITRRENRAYQRSKEARLREHRVALLIEMSLYTEAWAKSVDAVTADRDFPGSLEYKSRFRDLNARVYVLAPHAVVVAWGEFAEQQAIYIDARSHVFGRGRIRLYDFASEHVRVDLWNRFSKSQVSEDLRESIVRMTITLRAAIQEFENA